MNVRRVRRRRTAFSADADADAVVVAGGHGLAGDVQRAAAGVALVVEVQASTGAELCHARQCSPFPIGYGVAARWAGVRVNHAVGLARLLVALDRPGAIRARVTTFALSPSLQRESCAPEDACLRLGKINTSALEVEADSCVFVACAHCSVPFFPVAAGLLPPTLYRHIVETSYTPVQNIPEN